MEKRDLLKEVNIILTSDHGNEQVNGAKNIFCVKDYVDLSRVKFGHNMIYTADQALAREVYNNLSNAVDDTLLKIRVFTRNSYPVVVKGFPNDHFYKGMPSRIGDVILEPDIGYDVDFSCTRKQLDQLFDHGRIKLNRASHGQDPKNSEMLAMLVIGGPDVAKPARGFPNDHFYKGIPSRIGDVILEPDIGYDVDFTCTRKQLDQLFDHGRIKLNRASHGQDPKNSEMLAMLVIGGPDVAKPARFDNGLFLVAVPLLGIIVIVIICVFVRHLIYLERSEEVIVLLFVFG
ncbi:hypothetical protein TELCIR_16711 [Teladorsagia circumcincta]|uniref:Uncharacterized protein n=1 Tax=Teladorsagia circumcincta TaxID=45464 RepID=A0A2G9TV05_TELCI|nr:hypothetical protein TELCIR_16711 [Teladorsagia circumcincta]